MTESEEMMKAIRNRIKLENILIVDDEKVVCEYLKRALTHFGYRNLLVAYGAEEALERARAGDVALALIDIRMPGKDGLWLLRQIKELTDNTAVIVISASQEFEEVKEALNLGAENYLSKPVHMEALGHAVENVLEKRSLMMSNLNFRKKLESMVWDQE